MTDNTSVSPYVVRVPRSEADARADIERKRRESGLCPSCGLRRPRAETEVCEQCELKAQANVVDLDANDIKAWGG